MSSRIRRLDEAVRKLDWQLRELGEEYRQGRLRAGLTLKSLATAVGVSESTLRRIEAGKSRHTSPETLIRHGAALGMRTGIRTFPNGPPLHDAPQLGLIADFRGRIQPGGWDWDYEHRMPIQGDRRAIDAVISRPTCRCGLEFFVRFHDCQAQLRDVLLKQRDAGLPRLFVVVRGSNANRRALRSAEEVLKTALPLGTREVLAAPAAGRDPGANGLVIF
jgi:transcriptional regulator with XRE-family HTH domain